MIRLVGASKESTKKQGVSRAFEPNDAHAPALVKEFCDQFEEVAAMDSDGNLIEDGALVSSAKISVKYVDGEDHTQVDFKTGPLWGKVFKPSP